MKIVKKIDSGKVLISNNSEYYDNCPVCKLVKMSEQKGKLPSEKELEDAFTKANTQN